MSHPFFIFVLPLPPPVFQHGSPLSQSSNQTGLHTFTEVLRCGKGREEQEEGGVEQTSSPVACLLHSAVKARLCVRDCVSVHV